MKMKGTSWFFVFVLILGALTYYLEFVVPAQKEAQEKITSTVIPLQKDQINFVKITRDSTVIELNRSPDGWNLSAPIKDIADSESVESFLTDLTEQRASETAKEGAGIDWKTFSLDKPRATIELKNSAGTQIQIAISQSTNFEGKLYLRRNNEEKVLIGENRWQSIGDKSLFDFRDKRLLRGRTVSVDEVRWKSGNDTVMLTQKDNLWKMEGASFKLDAERIKTFLNWIQDARITEYISESGLSKTWLQEKKLKSPLAHIQLKLKDKDWEADFYRSEDGTFYGAVKEPNFVLKLTALEIEKLVKVNASYFRDHKEPFYFANESDVKTIQFESPLKKWQLNWVGNEWKLDSTQTSQSASSGATSEVDPEKVKSMLSKLRTLEADEFLGPQKRTKALENKLVLRDGQGKDIQIFQWGAPYKKKVDKEEKSYFTIQTSLLNESVALENSHFDGITVHDIFKTKEPPSTEASKGASPQQNGSGPGGEHSHEHQHGHEHGHQEMEVHTE